MFWCYFLVININFMSIFHFSKSVFYPLPETYEGLQSWSYPWTIELQFLLHFEECKNCKNVKIHVRGKILLSWWGSHSWKSQLFFQKEILVLCSFPNVENPLANNITPVNFPDVENPLANNITPRYKPFSRWNFTQNNSRCYHTFCQWKSLTCFPTYWKKVIDIFQTISKALNQT